MAHIQKRCRDCRRSVRDHERSCPSCGSRSVAYIARYVDPDRRERSLSFSRRLDADRYLADQESKKLHGLWVDPAAGKIALGEFADEWWEGTASLAPHTRRRYRSLIEVHIKPELGQRPLRSLEVADVRAFVSTLTQRGLAPKTVRHAYTLLLEILRDAQEDGLITAVPQPSRRQRRRVLPKVPHSEQRYLTGEEVARLASAVPLAPRYRAFVYLGAYGGLRWGELAGLRAHRVRLLERKVDVVETDQATEPKWGSAGTISIPAGVADEIARHLELFPPGPTGLVFTSPEGCPLLYGNFYRRHWSPAVRVAGLAPLRPHDLRHTAVALAIERGAHRAEIQELCRHRSISTTLGTYRHIMPQLHERLADRLNETFRAAREADRKRDVDGTNVMQFRVREEN